MSLKDLSRMAQRFFQCLEERQWTDAEAVMTTIQTCQTIKEDWMKGYANALQGIVMALRSGHSSPKPFVLTIGKVSLNKLKTLKKDFYGQSRGQLNADFDRGFFRTWYEYIKYLMDKGTV